MGGCVSSIADFAKSAAFIDTQIDNLSLSLSKQKPGEPTHPEDSVNESEPL